MPWCFICPRLSPLGWRAKPGNDAGRQVERAYRLALGREPEPDERAVAVRVVERSGLPTLARAIFNCNEFLYLD